MTFLRRAVAAHPLGLATVAQGAALSQFLNPECPGLVWQRNLPADMLAWLDALDAAALPDGRILVRPEDVHAAVETLFSEAATPPGPESAWLAADVAGLAQALASLMSARHLRLRLSRVTTNACRKFHVDAITARLVCTYRGTGTQYGFAVDGADPEPVFTVETGDPILLRGTLWPEKPATGLKHRSPPIEGNGATRLQLVLDPVFDPEDAI